MESNYRKIITNDSLPGRPVVAYDFSSKSLVHIYENISLETSNFQTEVTFYLNRKESFSGNVATVSKIKDERITYNLGNPSMEVSIVSDYVPYRLHLSQQQLTRQEGLFLLDGCLRGFRELLHRVRTPFPIEAFMIGVDGNGQVKVWWNQLYYRSNFGFNLNGHLRLREMVKLLVKLISDRMEPKLGANLEQTLLSGEVTFVALEEQIKQMTQGLNLKQFGKKLIQQCPQYQTVMQQANSFFTPRSSTILSESLMRSAVKYHSPQERVIISPSKGLEFSQHRSRLITKRVYKVGSAPSPDEKMKIIKQDIQKLRTVAQIIRQPTSAKLRSSKSVGSLFSYHKGLNGDTSIPQINKIIKESRVIGVEDQLTISRFIEPKIQSSTLIKANPEHCTVCSQVQQLRNSQLSGGDSRQKESLCLSRLQSLGGAEKSINSTSRSMTESKIKQCPESILKTQFGKSQKKLPQNMYFTTLFEM